MAQPTPDAGAGPTSVPSGPAGTTSDGTAAGGTAHAKVAAFFDLDNTIIRGASAFHLALGLRRRGFFSTFDFVTFAWHQARYLLLGEDLHQIDTVRSRALSIVAGHSVAEMAAIGEEIWDEVLSLRIFPGTQALLRDHLDAGHEVWIITASPVEIGALIGRRLEVTGALGTVAEHTDGHYTGRLVGDMLHGTAKATAVAALAAERGIDLAKSYAYGDSTHDVPILSSVGHPVAINPDRRLRAHARAVGWPVQEFRGRRRAAARRSAQTASWAGAAWMASVIWRTVARQVRRRLSQG